VFIKDTFLVQEGLETQVVGG